MKISTNWLSDYVVHGLPDEELADLLTMAGLEVEEIETIGSDLSGVVVGHVLDVQRHPNADRLSICSVDIGSGDPLSIVCGAANVAAGQKVPVATVGTTLLLPSRSEPGTLEEVTLSKTKIRGEVSYGMICAEDELGLSSDHSGIMVLDPAAEIGGAFSSYLQNQGIPYRDTAIDVAITPNRPDAICHLGIARDVAAVREVDLIEPSIELPETGGIAAETFEVILDAPDGCPRYVGLLVRGVTIGESPAWLQHRLRCIGLRPRNNVVDITNFVMYELGQPLHAFDFDQLAGSKIIVRETRSKSPFTTLDGIERELPSGTLMIADDERDIAIAGVMGGRNSEVTSETTNVLIESAYFNPAHIRRTSKALQLQTDASYRFERGIDPTGQARAASRAAQLMVEYAGGALVPGMVDAAAAPYQPRTRNLRPARVEAVLGIPVAVDRIQSLLSRIGFEIGPNGEEGLACTIPAFRPDIDREIDIIEEVARLVGYDAILEPKHSRVPNHTVALTPERILKEQVQELLVGFGYRETVTNSMLSREVADNFRDEILPGVRFGGEVVETLNPVSREMATLRPSLLPGVLRVAGHNQNRGQKNLHYFEFGNVQMRSQTERSVVEGYTESSCLLLLSSGQRNTAGWDTTARAEDLFDLKGVVEAVLGSVRLPQARFSPVYEGSTVSDHRLDIYSGDTLVGTLGKLKDAVSESFELRQSVFFSELDWRVISELAAPFLRNQYSVFSRQPVVDRDIAIAAGREVAVGSMMETIRKAGGELLQAVRVFDLYEGDQMESGMKSVAFALTFGSERTLRDEDVDKCVSNILSSLENEQGAKLRQ